jgi:hypothetical protein
MIDSGMPYVKVDRNYLTRCASKLAKEKVHEVSSEKPKQLSEEDPHELGRLYYHMFLYN